MSKNFFLVLIIQTLLLLFGSVQVRALGMDYDLYQKFLDTFVKQEKRIGGFSLNVVDYKAIHTLEKTGNSLYTLVLQMLETVDSETLKTAEENVAFWINVYNIGAIKMIVDHYPVDSIRSRKINWLKNPWKKKIITVSAKEYSLNEIEHEILLKKLQKPMAHFAIVCASLSCPELSDKVYRPETVDDQIAFMARAFLEDKKKGLKVDRKKGKVFFSQIFKFDKATFPKGAKDAISLIAPNIGKEDAKYLLAGEYSISYFPYDWSVNDLARARKFPH